MHFDGYYRNQLLSTIILYCNASVVLTLKDWAILEARKTGVGVMMSTFPPPPPSDLRHRSRDGRQLNLHTYYNRSWWDLQEYIVKFRLINRIF